MNIYEINVSSAYRQIVDYIKKGLQDIFLHSHASEGEVIVVNHFPAVTSRLGKIDLLITINIVDKKGNYYRYYCDNKYFYLHNLVIGIKLVSDDTINEVDDEVLFSTEGLLEYQEELKQEQDAFRHFTAMTDYPIRDCAFFYWILTKGCKKQFSNDYLLFNKGLDIVQLLKSACYREKADNSIKCLDQTNDISSIVKNYIDRANESSKVGILTKQRIDKITKGKDLQKVKDVLASDNNVCILSGRAGSGKTLMLTRIFYNLVSSGHHCRLLTYNNLLAFDLKYCLRSIEKCNNTNSSIQTLHHFFFLLSKKLGVQSVLTEGRLNELMEVCENRINIADKLIEQHLKQTGESINEKSFWKLFTKRIEDGDRQEIRKYIKYKFDAKNYQKKNDIIRKSYLDKRKELLTTELGRDVFLSDYNKVLETIYNLLENTRDFYEKYGIKNRRQLLNLMSKKTVEPDQNKEDYEFEDFEQDIYYTVKRKVFWWSKNMLIDEAQDCNEYEKLILLKLYESGRIIISTGGADQLIRTPKETSWTSKLGRPIPCKTISLGSKSYRQKANIVKFINAFADFYKIAKPIEPITETKGFGRVIIDISPGICKYNNDLVEELRKAGKVSGCTDYENCMVLLPSKGYSSSDKKQALIIDNYDNVSIIDKSTSRVLNIQNTNYKIWNGIVDNKSSLSVPSSDQTRFLYYESCRGLEAWNVLCVDLDSFFYTLRSSKDAETYAKNNSDIFINERKQKDIFALKWIYMVLTRPIDTLYMTFKNPSCPFAKQILDIAKKCDAEILYDEPIDNNSSYDVPF